MANSLIWLPDVLRGAALKVNLVDGWENRGRGDVGEIRGILCHHTAGAKSGNMPSLDLLIKGRQDLPGPLSQLGLARDGTYFVIAAGKCNHAGPGNWKGVKNGNMHFIGIEAENTGLPNDLPWPQVQMEAYQRGAAAILAHLGQPADFCAGHKEYALPPGRKTDPSFDMVAFRVSVAAIMGGAATVTQPAETTPQPETPTAKPTLRRGATGELVRQLQEKLGIDADGNFGPATEAAVRDFQTASGLTPDGVVGAKTWEALGS